MSDFDDILVDDLVLLPTKKKKIKSGAKGKGQERELVKILNARFAKIIEENPDNGAFSRSIGSGNRVSQVGLSENAKNIFGGDISVPSGPSGPVFLFVIESKKGYNDIDLNQAFSGKCKGLDDFLDQVLKDAKNTGRHPILVWKKDRKDAISFIKQDLNIFPKFCYNDWFGYSFDKLLQLPDDFWFRF